MPRLDKIEQKNPYLEKKMVIEAHFGLVRCEISRPFWKKKKNRKKSFFAGLGPIVKMVNIFCTGIPSKVWENFHPKHMEGDVLEKIQNVQLYYGNYYW